MGAEVQDNVSVAVLDTGLSNLQSVTSWLGLEFSLIETITMECDFSLYDLLVMPGVGSFDELIKTLDSYGALTRLREYISSGGKYLGICLGFQVLFESSSEGYCKGLGIFPYRIEKLNRYRDVRLPHVGFARINQGKNDYGDFYFIHSYGLLDMSSISHFDNAVITDYCGEEFVSMFVYKNIMACQFHPEKSALAGRAFLKKTRKWL